MRHHHWLRAARETVKTGVIDRNDPAVLEIDSGDEVSIETWSGWGNAIGPTTTLDDVMRLAGSLAEAGPHDVTGPIAVRGARPGQVLRIDVLKLNPEATATNLNVPGAAGVGLLPELFPEGGLRHYELDLDAMTVAVAPGVVATLAPFLGFMGVAPRDEGPHNTIPPGPHGGNIDLKDLVTGASLYLPIWNDGALFYAGDGHARQGNGEVNVTALEVRFTEARLRLTVIDRPPLDLPRAENGAGVDHAGIRRRPHGSGKGGDAHDDRADHRTDGPLAARRLRDLFDVRRPRGHSRPSTARSASTRASTRR